MQVKNYFRLVDVSSSPNTSTPIKLFGRSSVRWNKTEQAIADSNNDITYSIFESNFEYVCPHPLRSTGFFFFSPPIYLYVESFAFACVVFLFGFYVFIVPNVFPNFHLLHARCSPVSLPPLLAILCVCVCVCMFCFCFISTIFLYCTVPNPGYRQCS